MDNQVAERLIKTIETLTATLQPKNMPPAEDNKDATTRIQAHLTPGTWPGKQLLTELKQHLGWTSGDRRIGRILTELGHQRHRDSNTRYWIIGPATAPSPDPEPHQSTPPKP